MEGIVSEHGKCERALSRTSRAEDCESIREK
jgi:hypothetical protein